MQVAFVVVAAADAIALVTPASVVAIAALLMNIEKNGLQSAGTTATFSVALIAANAAGVDLIQCVHDRHNTNHDNEQKQRDQIIHSDNDSYKSCRSGCYTPSITPSSQYMPLC